MCSEGRKEKMKRQKKRQNKKTPTLFPSEHLPEGGRLEALLRRHGLAAAPLGEPLRRPETKLSRALPAPREPRLGVPHHEAVLLQPEHNFSKDRKKKDRKKTDGVEEGGG